MAKLSDPDNKKWKDRKDSMDKIISVCGSNSLAMSPLAKDLATQLGKCLNDLQVIRFVCLSCSCFR